VTAVAALDDDVACRVLAAMHDLGLTAPDDPAVIGYDDTEHGALTTPPLTTIHIDAEAHGRLAARTVLGLDTAGLAHARARDRARVGLTAQNTTVVLPWRRTRSWQCQCTARDRTARSTSAP
jgi:DNA-binding LacI/PurR family transcriptional regulator